MEEWDATGGLGWREGGDGCGLGRGGGVKRNEDFRGNFGRDGKTEVLFRNGKRAKPKFENGRIANISGMNDDGYRTIDPSRGPKNRLRVVRWCPREILKSILRRTVDVWTPLEGSRRSLMPTSIAVLINHLIFKLVISSYIDL
jgi:hypothetical protein